MQIQIPYGAMNSGAAQKVSKEIRGLLVESGIRSTVLVQSSYDAGSTDQSAPVRLSFVAVTAVTDQCGNWPKDLMNNSFSNKNWDNFGCATQQNLAAQIANPMDIVAPRGMTPIDAQRRSNVLTTYRKGS
jgi:pilus assembly protein CpaD